MENNTHEKTQFFHMHLRQFKDDTLQKSIFVAFSRASLKQGEWDWMETTGWSWFISSVYFPVSGSKLGENVDLVPANNYKIQF